MFSEENEEYMDSKKRLDSELPNSAKTDSWNAETKTVTRSVSTDGILYATEKIPTAEEEINNYHMIKMERSLTYKEYWMFVQHTFPRLYFGSPTNWWQG